MPSHSQPKRRRRSASIAWELAFEAEARQLPARHQAALLRWLRRWRLRAGRSASRLRPGILPPPRIFWVMDPTGGWYPLI